MKGCEGTGVREGMDGWMDESGRLQCKLQGQYTLACDPLGWRVLTFYAQGNSTHLKLKR